jgi:hypothetical protein
MNNNLIRWLTSKVNDDTIHSIYDDSEYTLNNFLNEYEYIDDYTEFYNDGDIDMVLNTDPLINDKSMSHLVERYRPASFFKQDTWAKSNKKVKVKELSNDNRSIDIFIPPNSNRYHTNYLFKKLVDESLKNDMYYHLDSVDPYRLFDITMKESFYKFCMKNTIK